MNRRWKLCVVAVWGLACGVAAAQDLTGAEKDIAEKWQRHRSMRARIAIAGLMDRNGNKATTRGEGTLEFLRRGDELLYRWETKKTLEVEAAGQKLKFDSTTLAVCDGKYTYTLNEQVGRKNATRTKGDPRSPANPPALLEALRKGNSLKLLDAAQVSGEPAYVIEATPKTQRPNDPVHATVYFFSREHGVLLKEEQRDKDGRPVETTTYSAFEFDVAIDPDRFEFKAPEGVAVQDQTGK